MGCFVGLPKSGQVWQAARCAVAPCLAGIVLFIGAPPALADAAPISQEAIGGTRQAQRMSPALRSPRSQPPGSERATAAQSGAVGPMPPAGHAVIVVTPLDLGRLEPQAYADWEQVGH